MHYHLNPFSGSLSPPFFRALGWMGLAAITVLAQDPEAGGHPLLSADLDWLPGPATAQIGDVAEIQVPEGFVFTGAQGTQSILEMSGNPVSGDELGFIAPTSLVWSAVFEWSEVGYVKDISLTGASLHFVKEYGLEPGKHRFTLKLTNSQLDPSELTISGLKEWERREKENPDDPFF